MQLNELQRIIVKRARDRIADPANWCRGALARREDNTPCKPRDPAAVKFSAYCALLLEAAPFYRTKWGVEVAVIDISRAVTGCASDELMYVNRSTDGHKKVLAIFDKALAE